MIRYLSTGAADLARLLAQSHAAQPSPVWAEAQLFSALSQQSVMKLPVSHLLAPGPSAQRRLRLMPGLLHWHEDQSFRGGLTFLV